MTATKQNKSDDTQMTATKQNKSDDTQMNATKQNKSDDTQMNASKQNKSDDTQMNASKQNKSDTHMIPKRHAKASESNPSKMKRWFRLECKTETRDHLCGRLPSIKIENKSPGREFKYKTDYDLAYFMAICGARALQHFYCNRDNKKKKSIVHTHKRMFNYMKRTAVKYLPVNLSIYSMTDIYRYIDSIMNDREKQRALRLAIRNLFNIYTEAEFDRTQGKAVSRVLTEKVGEGEADTFDLLDRVSGENKEFREVTNFLRTNVNREQYLKYCSKIFHKRKRNVFNNFLSTFQSRYSIYRPDIEDIKKYLGISVYFKET